MNQELKNKLLENGYKNKFELSELIEACGSSFQKIKLLSGKWDSPTGVYWKAESIEFFDIPIGFQGGGSTPEEAVANLWLELRTS